MFPRLRSFLTTLSQPRRFDAALDEEVRFHLEAETDHLIQTGLARPEAARRAKLRFGSITALKDQCRRVRGLAPLDGFATALQRHRATWRTSSSQDHRSS